MRPDLESPDTPHPWSLDQAFFGGTLEAFGSDAPGVTNCRPVSDPARLDKLFDLYIWDRYEPIPTTHQSVPPDGLTWGQCAWYECLGIMKSRVPGAWPGIVAVENMWKYLPLSDQWVADTIQGEPTLVYITLRADVVALETGSPQGIAEPDTVQPHPYLARLAGRTPTEIFREKRSTPLQSCWRSLLRELEKREAAREDNSGAAQ